MNKLDAIDMMQAEVTKCETELKGSYNTLLAHNTLIQVGPMYLKLKDGKGSMADSPLNATWFERERAIRNAPEVSNGNGDIGKPIFYRTALEQYIDEKQGVIDYLQELVAEEAKAEA
jgi:hypothetical protein